MTQKTLSVPGSELNENEQIKGEHFQPTDRVKVYILKVENANKGPRVLVSRTHPGRNPGGNARGLAGTGSGGAGCGAVSDIGGFSGGAFCGSRAGVRRRAFPPSRGTRRRKTSGSSGSAATRSGA